MLDYEHLALHGFLFPFPVSLFCGHWEHFCPLFVPIVRILGTLGTLLPTFRSRCPCFGDTGHTFAHFSFPVSVFWGHWAHFCPLFVPGVRIMGTLGTLLPAFRSHRPYYGDVGHTLWVRVCKVVLKMGHLARLGGDSVQGGV